MRLVYSFESMMMHGLANPKKDPTLIYGMHRNYSTCTKIKYIHLKSLKYLRRGLHIAHKHTHTHIYIYIYRVYHKSDLTGKSTSKTHIQRDVRLFAGTGSHNTAHCITHILKSEV